MSIEKIKQELSQKGMKEKPEKMPSPPQKKDTSGFGGRPYLSGERFRQWLRRPELFTKTGMTESQRLEFEKTARPIYKILLEKGEPEKIKRDLEMGRIKLPSGVTKEKAKRLIDEFLGKK